MDGAVVGPGSLWRNSIALEGASHRRLPVTVFTVVKEVGGMGTTGRAKEWSGSTPSNRLDAPDFISQVSETSPPLWNRPRSFFFLLLYPSVASLESPSPLAHSSFAAFLELLAFFKRPSVPLGGFLKLLQRFQGELRIFFLHFCPYQQELNLRRSFYFLLMFLFGLVSLRSPVSFGFKRWLCSSLALLWLQMA
jgi:hypothetical protein